MSAPIVVTGGTGNLGGRVVAGLRNAGRDVRVLSRRPRASQPGIEQVRGDTLEGTGLAEAFAGAETVIHLAGGPKGDDVATKNVANAAASAGVTHVVLISVIGAGSVPIGYFRAKADAEQALAESGVGYSILRAAQFHDFLYPVLKVVAATPLVLAPRGMRFEPVDPNVVAARLVELALGAPAGRVADAAGPEVLDVAELAREWRASRGGTVRGVVRMPLAGAIGRAYRAGDNLAGSNVIRAGSTWAENLTGLRAPTRRTAVEG